MLLQLAVKLFFANSKRTIRGAQIIAISLIAISATNLLINSFTSEISVLTNLLVVNEDYIIVEHVQKRNFSKSQIDAIEKMQQDFGVITQVDYELKSLSPVRINNSVQQSIIHFVDLQSFFNDQTLEPDSAVISSDLFHYFDNPNTVEVIGFQPTILNIEQIVDTKTNKIDTGLYVDITLLGDNNYNLGFITLESKIWYQTISKEISRIPDLVVLDQTSEQEFINSAIENIETTLLLLIIMISTIVYLSISNIVSTIILESRYEIRTLKSLGYHVNSIRWIFILISSFMGVLGSILTIILSLLLLNLIISLLSLLTALTYITVSITLNDLIVIIQSGIVVSVVSAIVPSLRSIQ